MLKDSSVIAQVSMIIYDVRKQAGLTQRQLANLVGTTRSPLAQAELSVIARLEDADYNGHSLPMLARIASALGQKLEIKMLLRASFANVIAEVRRCIHGRSDSEFQATLKHNLSR
jgi:transcriptional regulator with XRE-family HTH domain